MPVYRTEMFTLCCFWVKKRQLFCLWQKPKRHWPFEINIQPSASEELFSTKCKNTELNSRGSSMKTISDLLRGGIQIAQLTRWWGISVTSCFLTVSLALLRHCVESTLRFNPSFDEAQPVETEFDGADQGIYSVKL